MSKTIYLEEEERSNVGAHPEFRLFEEIIARAVTDARLVPIELTERKQRDKTIARIGKEKYEELLSKEIHVFVRDATTTKNKKLKKDRMCSGRTEETIAARDAIDFLMTPERSDVFLHIAEVDPETFRENMLKLNAVEGATEHERKARRIFRANLDFYHREKARGRRI